MSASLLTFTPETDVLAAINSLIEKGVSGAPVLDKLGNLVGMLSEAHALVSILPRLCVPQQVVQ